MIYDVFCVWIRLVYMLLSKPPFARPWLFWWWELHVRPILRKWTARTPKVKVWFRWFSFPNGPLFAGEPAMFLFFQDVVVVLAISDWSSSSWTHCWYMLIPNHEAKKRSRWKLLIPRSQVLLMLLMMMLMMMMQPGRIFLKDFFESKPKELSEQSCGGRFHHGWLLLCLGVETNHRSESRWLATPKRWQFVRGYDKPIHGSCAIYFPGGMHEIIVLKLLIEMRVLISIWSRIILWFL